MYRPFANRRQGFAVKYAARPLEFVAVAPVAQLDRAPPSGGGSQGFESLRARHIFQGLTTDPALRRIFCAQIVPIPSTWRRLPGTTLTVSLWVPIHRSEEIQLLQHPPNSLPCVERDLYTLTTRHGPETAPTSTDSPSPRKWLGIRPVFAQEEDEEALSCRACVCGTAGDGRQTGQNHRLGASAGRGRTHEYRVQPKTLVLLGGCGTSGGHLPKAISINGGLPPV